MNANDIEQIKNVASAMKKGGPVGSTAVIVNLSDIQREEVSWLWHHRIARKKLTIVEGDPGTGKSWLVAALASAVTTGKTLPGQSNTEPEHALLLIAEDGLSDTIRPRFEDMGADLTKVQIVEAIKTIEGKEKHISLSHDLEALEHALQQHPYALVVIDPLNAYLGDVDSHKDADMRSILTPLAKLADRCNVAIVCIRHLSKSIGTKAIYRGIGSIAYTAAARTVLLVGKNPDNEDERIIINTKNNLAPLAPSLKFEIKDNIFEWRGETDITAEMLLQTQNEEDTSALSEAKDFLLDTLSLGDLSSTKVRAQATEAGISKRTLDRAKKALGIKAQRTAFGAMGEWLWSLSTTKNANITKEQNLALLTDETTCQHEFGNVTNIAGTHLRCKKCLEFPPKK